MLGSRHRASLAFSRILEIETSQSCLAILIAKCTVANHYKADTPTHASMMLPQLDTFILCLGKKFFAKENKIHRDFIRERLVKRLEMKDPRPD